jgi:chaperone BCS1
MNSGPAGPLGGLLDTTNPYFSAGAGLFLIGGGATLLRGGLKYGTAYFQRNFMVKMEIPSKDPSYSWVLNWITARAARQTQHLSVETFYQKDPTGRIKTSYNLIPSTGRHFIKHKVQPSPSTNLPPLMHSIFCPLLFLNIIMFYLC